MEEDGSLATGADGRYELMQQDEGLYLSVWPPQGNGEAVSVLRVIEALRQQGQTDIDIKQLPPIVAAASGQPVRLTVAAATMPQADIRVMVRRDRMAATLQITLPPGAAPVTREQLTQSLQTAGVLYGVDEAMLDWLVRTRSQLAMVCAHGTPPQPGQDAYIRYLVDLEQQGRPVELEDGSVDFKNINQFLSVTAGQLLAEKVPPTEGIPGRDVLGLEVPAKPGRDIGLPFGKNIVCEDNCRLVAAIDGQLQVKQNRLQVLPVLEVPGDIDYATGNIDFIGSVVVHGSLQTGFAIKAVGNVEIKGSICGGMVEAGSLLVRRGIQGMNRTVVKVRERVVAMFIENAKVYADQEIMVRDVVLNSDVFAGVRVILEGKRGMVIGGRISAGEEIRVANAGNQAHVTTRMEVASNPFLKEELTLLRQEGKKLAARCSELEHSLAYMNRQAEHSLSPERRAQREAVQAELTALPEQLTDCQERIQELELLLQSLGPGKVRVANTAYPGVKVGIGLQTKSIHDALRHLSVYCRDGEIRLGPF